jgi:hypothetical protein
MHVIYPSYPQKLPISNNFKKINSLPERDISFYFRAVGTSDMCPKWLKILLWTSISSSWILTPYRIVDLSWSTRKEKY